MSCQCDVCKMIGRFTDIREKLPAEDAQYLEDFLEHYLNESADRDYYEAVIDGSWPDAIDTMRGWIRRALGRERITITAKGRELLEKKNG